ncbi:HYC_CC_PP family protein [Capnocytophaga canimorsus]|uniref:HYC_CC_PP family protein n=1 Tax=Capnocytophaga canimorsus TaxID=28188 RepID=UPI0037D1351D
MITKLGHILFSLLLIFSNSGLAFSLHYCKEKLASVSVTIESMAMDKEPDSCCLSDKENTSCCDDKSVEAPETDDEFLSKILKINESTFILPYEVAHIFVKTASAERKLSNSYTQNTQSNSPPLYQLYCRLVFYA